MKKLIAEFKEFIARGNVLDLAIGVIIGGAFAAITSALVESIIMPIVGIFIGGLDLSKWVINVPNFIYGGEPIAIGIGAFLNAIINFIIIALVLFAIIKAFNALKKKEKEEEAPAPDPEPSAEEKLLTEIRDLLAKK